MSDELKKLDQSGLTENEAPKRFVRTFESDSAAVQHGSRPGFTEVEDAVAPEPAEPVDTPREMPPPPKYVPPASVEPTGTASARLVGGSVFPTFSLKNEPIKAPPQPPPPPPPPEKAPIHTYTSDFAAHLKDSKASTASVLAAESNAPAKPTTRVVSSFNIPLIAGGIVLILLGGGGAHLAYQYTPAPVPIQIAVAVTTPIFVDEHEQIRGTALELSNAMVASVQKELGSGKVRHLYSSTSTSDGSDLFHALQLPAPGILLRNIISEGSMAGVVHAGSQTSPFFILKVSSYGDTFAGMLSWEPKMSAGLAAFYPPSATTTLAFKDEIISSHDLRVMRDASGESILLYGYWDPKTLIIARNENAYRELLKRLSTSRTTH